MKQYDINVKLNDTGESFTVEVESENAKSIRKAMKGMKESMKGKNVSITAKEVHNRESETSKK